MKYLLVALAWMLAASGAAPVWAQPAGDDPPGRVGRLSETRGGVSWYDADSGQWSDADRNRPLTSGDRLSTAPQGRAELRVGSTVLRLGGATELELLRVDDERLVFQLHSGSLALRVKAREAAEEIEVMTREVRLTPQRAGHYRIDRIDDSTFAGSWRGDLRIDDAFGFSIATGQRVELWREGSRRGGGSAGGAGELRHAWNNLPTDEFAERVIAEDRRDDQRSVATRYVSPEMTGAEDLDRYGRWDRHPEHGAVWYPIEVRAGWAPYRHGRWAWVRPWGWTWVDEAPWGFAPFHYGRWVWWNARWGWVPGVYVQRPVFAPALVAWIGGPHLSVSVQIGGGPQVGWVPLAPREQFQPYYRHTPRYVDRVNHGPMPQRPGQPRPLPAQPVMYGNQGVPGAVTVVPRDALLQRQPIGRVAVGPEATRDIVNAPIMQAAPPASMGPQRPAARELERPFDRAHERLPQQGPAAAPMPVPAPERAMERQFERQQERQPERPVFTGPADPQQARPERPLDRTQDRNGEHRSQPWPRRGGEQAAPDARRERVVPAAEPAAVQQAQPQPKPQPQPQVQPQLQPQVQSSGPQRPVSPPPVAAPQPQPQTQPQRPPEAEKPRETKRPQPAADEDRKRAPEPRGGARERDDAR